MPHHDDAMHVAQRFTEALADRDIASLESILSDNATVWHNTDGLTQTRGQAVATITEFLSSVSECSYAAIRRTPTPSGLVQQHDLRVRFGPDAALIVVPACLIFEITDGKVSRLEEYLDISAFSSVPAEAG